MQLLNCHMQQQTYHQQQMQQMTVHQATSMGATVSMGDLTVTVAQNEQEETTHQEKHLALVLVCHTFFSEGLTLKAHNRTSDDDADASVDNSETAASLTYTVAPGLTANIAYTDSEAGTVTGTATTAYLKVAF